MRAKQYILLHELIGKVYDAALDAQKWAGLCGEIATAFRASSAAVQSRPTDQGRHNRDGAGTLVAPFAPFCWQRDTWMLRTWELARRGEIRAGTPCGDDGADWRHQGGVCHVLGARFALSSTEMGILRIHRSRAQGCYDHMERASVSTLLPHLKRAMLLRNQVAHAGLAERFSMAVLDGCTTAAFIVDAGMAVLHATPCAAALLEYGTPLRLLGGKLTTTGHHGEPGLPQLVRAVLPASENDAPPLPRSLCLARGGRGPLTLTVAPLPSTCLPPYGAALAIILVRDPEQVTASASALQQLFDLTPAEALVAKSLAEGVSLEEMALAHAVSLNTVKTHVHRIFEKTATKRQGELIALIHGSTATFTGEAYTPPTLSMETGAAPDVYLFKRHHSFG